MTLSKWDDGLLLAIDELAHDWSADVPEIRFAAASSDAERQAYFRLRYEVIIDRGWAEPDELPDGRECDAYDERAVHLLGWDGDRLAAAARLLLPAPDTLLPTEEVFGIRIEPAGQVANVDRVIVARDYRDRRAKLFRALLAQCWLALREKGLVVWAGIDSLIMIRLFRRLGFEVRVLGMPKTYWGQPRYPVRFEPTRAVAAIRGEPNRWRERWIREREEHAARRRADGE